MRKGKAAGAKKTEKGCKSREALAMTVSWNTIAANLLLSAGKLAAGFWGHSAAMLSDAVHSASDVLSTLVVMAGIRLSDRESDENHPYGHERLECVASVLLAVMLGATGFMIGWSGIKKILAGSGAVPVIPGTVALAAAVISIAVKEAMYHYTKAAAKKTDSDALMADAWHHR